MSPITTLVLCPQFYLDLSDELHHYDDLIIDNISRKNLVYTVNSHYVFLILKQLNSIEKHELHRNYSD